MKININKEQLAVIGKAGLKIGKAIIIEGTKAVAVKSVTAIIMEGFDNGSDGIKGLSIDNLVSGGKEKPKKEGGLFKRKKKKEEGIPVDIVLNQDDELVAIVPKGAFDKKDETKED